MVMRSLSLVSAAGLMLLAACASTNESYTGRTATEQLLMSRAADRAVEGLKLPLAAGKKVFIDGTYFNADNPNYAISVIRQAVSQGGYALAARREDADAVLELRAGAFSLEQMRRVVGMPAIAVPVNDSFNVVSFPELSVYSRRDRVGVAEFSGFVYDAQTGAPIGAISPMIGEYRIRSHKLLMVVAWGQQQAEPGERDPGVSWRSF